MNVKMKNIAQSEVLTLKDEISYQKGQVVSKTLAQNDAVSITLFSFDKGEEISAHDSRGDALALVSELSVSLSVLPAAAQEEVQDGLGFSTPEELEAWLENMES